MVMYSNFFFFFLNKNRVLLLINTQNGQLHIQYGYARSQQFIFFSRNWNGTKSINRSKPTLAALTNNDAL